MYDFIILNYILTIVFAIILALFSIGLFYLVQKKLLYKKFRNKLIIGLLYGFIAILLRDIMYKGIDGIACIQDAAILCAGLFFGETSALVAGAVSCIRLADLFFGGTINALLLGEILSGLVTCILVVLAKRFILDDKRPSISMGIGITLLNASIHMVLLLMCGSKDVIRSIEMVENITGPIIVGTIIVILGTICGITLIESKANHNKDMTKAQKDINAFVQDKMFVTLLGVFVLSLGMLQMYQYSEMQSDIGHLLRINARDAANELTEVVDLSVKNNIQSELTIEETAATCAENRHIGESGFILIFDENHNLLSGPAGKKGMTINTEEVFGNIRNARTSNFIYKARVYDEEYYCRCYEKNGFYIVATISVEEARKSRVIAMYISAFLDLLLFAVLYTVIFLVIKNHVSDKVKEVNDTLEKIIDGDLEQIVNVRENSEFSTLSDGINKTVDTLKKLAEEAKERMASELEFAKHVQEAALPAMTPPYCNRNEFEIFAMMRPAKEVGGDFYDFYQIDAEHLVLTIADVSGKGIPAAMFMMTAKTLIHNMMFTKGTLSGMVEEANTELSDNNSVSMFVTAWIGILNINTGELRYVNAGHNPPIIRRANGDISYLRNRSGLILAAEGEMPYKEYTDKLEKGDVLFLYTDGVTEATDISEELYGENRLENIIRKCYRDEMSIEELEVSVFEDVDRFVGKAPQFDDITVLSVRKK